MKTAPLSLLAVLVLFSLFSATSTSAQVPVPPDSAPAPMAQLPPPPVVPPPPPIAQPMPPPPPQYPPPAYGPPRAPIRFAGQLAFDIPLTTMVKVEYVGGETRDIGPGGLVLLAGAAFPFDADGMFEGQLVGGIRINRAGASNGEVYFMDFPVEATGHVNFGGLRLGAGPSLHLGPRLSGSGIAGGLDTSFDTAIGVVGVAEYVFRSGRGGFSLGMRATWLRLSVGGASVDGSSIGFLLGFFL